MAKLTDEIRRFMVERLAMFDSPSEVAAAVKEEFGVEITRQQAEEYDPTKRTPARKWVAHFNATREAFLTETAREPAAERAYRVRRLANMARAAEAAKNVKRAAELYRQIAEEMGGKYTNRMIVSDSPAQLAKALGMTEAEVIALLAGGTS